MTTLENLKWRYATKKFDATKKISSEDLDKLKEAVRLSPTSYGLQLFKVLDVQNEEKRKALQPASWGQTQIVDASNLFVFLAKKNFGAEDVDNYVNLKADTMGMDASELQGYADFAKGKLQEFPEDMYKQWTSKQAYIVMGNLMTAAAELHIDTCPMEGFEPEKYDEILGLNDTGYTAVVVVTLGYRSDEDPTKDGPKIRKSNEQLFETV